VDGSVTSGSCIGTDLGRWNVGIINVELVVKHSEYIFRHGLRSSSSRITLPEASCITRNMNMLDFGRQSGSSEAFPVTNAMDASSRSVHVLSPVTTALEVYTHHARFNLALFDDHLG
jgi:hypothetical protein